MKVGSFWLPFHDSASQMRDALHHEEEWATKFVWGAENVGTKWQEFCTSGPDNQD